MRNVAKIRRDKEQSPRIPTIFILETVMERNKINNNKQQIINQILRLQLSVLKKIYPTSEVYIICGEHFYSILNLQSEFGARLIHNQHYHHTNELYDVSLGLASSLSENILIICGNILFNKSSLKNIAQDVSKILIDTRGTTREPLGAISQRHRLISLSYNIYPKWGGIINLKGKPLEVFRDFVLTTQNQKLFLYEGINYLTNNDLGIYLYNPRSPFLLRTSTINHIKYSHKMIYT